MFTQNSGKVIFHCGCGYPRDDFFLKLILISLFLQVGIGRWKKQFIFHSLGWKTCFFSSWYRMRLIFQNLSRWRSCFQSWGNSSFRNR